MPSRGETVAQAVMAQLRQAGVDRIFGHPGGEVLSLIEAASRQGIDFVMARHEAAAGNMAACYGKASGTPGVVLATLGPGAANLSLAIANSLLDREPLVAIAAQISSEWPDQHTHQKLPLESMYRPVTKYVNCLTSANVGQAMNEAIAAATNEPLGPAFVTVSSAEADKEVLAPTHAETHVGASSGPNDRADPQVVARAVAERIRLAKRPMVLAGLGVSGPISEPLSEWVGRWRLPVLVTPKVKGLIDERHPSFVGVAGGMAADRVARDVIHEADLIIGWGFDPVEVDGLWHAEIPIMWVLESPNVGGLVPDGALMTSHREALDALIDMEPIECWPEASLAELRGRITSFLVPASNGDAGGLAPTVIVTSIREGAPETAILTTDVGAHKCLFGQFWETYEPKSFWMSNGLSGMGYGMPAAIGLKLANPDRPVVAVVGDGGFAMNAAELETAVRAGAPIVVVVLVDMALSLIKLVQERRNLETIGTEFQRLDAVAVASGWGVRGVRVATPSELTQEVGKAVSDEAATVIEVPTNYSGYKPLFE